MAVCSGALRSARMGLVTGQLDTLPATHPWHVDGQRKPDPCRFTALCWAFGRGVEILKGDNLTTLERCTVSFPRSHFTPSGLSTQRSGTNGGIRWCSSSLVMLESQLHLSFCVRDRIVFVCHRRQINCGVVWRTELRPPIPSPSSVPPASHRSLLTRVCLPLFSYPPLSARLRLSHVPSCSLSPALCSFGAGSLLFRTSCLLHEENSFCCRCDTPQLLSPSRLSHFHNNRMVFYEDWVSSAPSCFPLSLPCPNLLPSDPNPFVLCP